MAGTVLALQLMERGEEVYLIDDGHRSSSSMVAAGLWNPIVFRRINKSWLADEVTAAMADFYPRQEERLGVSCYHELPIWRKHSSALEKNLWESKSQEAAFEAYLFDEEVAYAKALFTPFEFGYGTVKNAGYLDLPVFLSAARQFFLDRGMLLEKTVKWPSSTEQLNSMKVAGQNPRRIIDSRGYKTAASSWFSYLPFGLTKGEVLTVRCPELDLDRVFNAGFFLQPLGNHTYRLGATFNWDQKDENPTEEARSALLQKFSRHINSPVEVVGHKAGVRPTVQDRRPLIGQHPEANKLYVFNGLGTKGVMLAPLMATYLADHLLNGSTLPAEVDIKRFEHLLGQKEPQISHP